MFIAGQVSDEEAKAHGAKAGRPTNNAQPDWLPRVAELLTKEVLRPVVRAVFPLGGTRGDAAECDR